MPNSQHDLPMGPAGLRDYLSEALPKSKLREVSADNHYQPILLLETPQVMAGFGFSNGDMGKSYEVLYSGFKRQYAARRTELDALDLAFVFCVPPESPGLDRFCSKVETNVYFCRKFVVPLARPVADALARLPFLPLAPVQGRSLRPPSAQTFLQQCGTPAVLAKYLVVQGERSPETIVEDCLSETFGEPKALRSSSRELKPVESLAATPVRLERIKIQNFRAYRKAQTFVFGDDVTVLYGPNGFGKTSVFDAIDFAATGNVGRLRISGDSHFKKAAAHLDSRAEDSSVSLLFEVNGVKRKIVRRVSDRKHALLDGIRSDRKAILAELTGGSGPATDRVENLVNLFRATHLFSQEHQELAKDFEEDCELPQQVVSRLLAFEDYSNAWKKASRVCKVIDTIIRGAAREIEQLRGHIEEEEEELERLGRTSQEHVGAGELDEAMRSLCQRVAGAGVEVPSDSPDVATLRAWRATFETRSAEFQAKKGRLSELVKEAVELPKAAAELAAIRRQIAKKEEALTAAVARQKASEDRLQIAERKFAEANQGRTALEAQLSSLAWLRERAPLYAALIKRQQLAVQLMDKASEVLALAKDEERKAAESLKKSEDDKTAASAELIVMRGRVATLNGMIKASEEWEVQRSRLVQTAEEEQAAVKSLEQLRAEDRDTMARQERIKEEEADLLGQIKDVDKAQSELRRLLSQVQSHVRSGVCPLCGEDHGSVETLLKRIEGQVSTDAASAARIALSRVRSDVREVSASRSSLATRQERAARELATLKSEHSRLVREIAAFEEDAEKLGVEVHSPQAAPIQEFIERRNGLLKEITELEQEASIKGKKVHAAGRSVEEARSVVTARYDEVGSQRRLLSDIQERIEQLREDPRIGQETIDVSATEIEERTRVVREELARFEGERTTADGILARQKESLQAVRLEIESVQTDLSSLQVKAASLQARSNEMVARLQGAGLPDDTNEDSLVALISEMGHEQARSAELRDAVASIELAVDAATTGAAFKRLHQGIHRRKEAIKTAQRKQERHKPWLKYFEALSELLSSEQSAAVLNFTSAYGPRTSVIQKRLRSVYGFDEIEILSEKSKIRVRAKRRGEELRPTDYFSQSQQQTLLLGLFLTTCLSQTWSALSPVFLDDPVTHFDDLNMYAFLDLIVGLFDSEPGQRQFVISTCDEKFLQLARQKFRHLGHRARFYTFAAIGEEGPVVHEVLSSERTISVTPR